ncbi:MAG TPA: hypothetical protein VFP84_21885 [Kofleriaceae bacterium]|nr:hypothetical protein [Kofleriaceae bacterium]
MPHDHRSFEAGWRVLDQELAPIEGRVANELRSLGLPPARAARVRLHDAPRDVLVEILSDPLVHDALPELVPLLKPSDVVPCLAAPGLAGRLVPCLAPAQCKLLGPEHAATIAPHLAARWPQIAHLPIETVVMLPTEALSSLPAPVLRALPAAHQAYLAPYVKRVRNASEPAHDRVLCEALCEILHLHAHKVLDPEHIPNRAQLAAHASLAGERQRLRWLVDAVMDDAVRVVQLAPLKLNPLIVELRRAGLRALAGELAQLYHDHKDLRGLWFGADALAYTDDHVLAVRQQAVGELDAIAGALRDAVRRHTPLPTARGLAIVALDLAPGVPRGAAQHALELAIAEQLAASGAGVTVEEVVVRWPTGATTTYRRQHNAKYRPARPRFVRET